MLDTIAMPVFLERRSPSSINGLPKSTAAVNDLADRLRVLDALYIPRAIPIRFQIGLFSDHFGGLQSADLISLPVRSLKQSVWRCSTPENVLGGSTDLGSAAATAGFKLAAVGRVRQ